MLNRLKKFFGLKKYNFKRIYESEMMSKFQLNTSISRYITKSNLIARIPNHSGLPILIIQMNKIHRTLECFLDDGSNIPFKIYDYSILPKKYDEYDIIEAFVNTVKDKPGYTIFAENEHEIILDQPIYITPDEYLDLNIAGTRKLYYYYDTLSLKYFDNNNTEQTKVLNLWYRGEISVHKYLVLLNNLNKTPEKFIKMEN